MVKNPKRNITRSKVNKGKKRRPLWTRKISASTPYETCSEPLSAFGGVLALIKFLDLVRFEKVFEHCYKKPARGPKLGHYRMVAGIVMLLPDRVQPDRAFQLHQIRCHVVQIFTGSEFTGCEHILALCEQPGNQSGPGTFSGDERFAGAGVATVRDQTPANKYRH